MKIFKGSKEKRNKMFNKIKQLDVRRKMAIVGTGLSMISFGIIGYDVNNNRTVAEATDLEGDSYESIIPLETSNGSIEFVPENSLVIVNSKKLAWPDPEELLSVSAISQNGEYITGNVSAKYLKKVGKVSKKKLEKYNKIFTVSAENAKFKVDPKEGEIEENCVSNIPKNTQVLVSENDKEILDDGNWLGILYIDEKGNIRELYGRQQDLLGNDLALNQDYNEEYDMRIGREVKSNLKVKETSEVKMFVHTEEGGINLREEKTIDDDNVIVEIPNGAIVYALDNISEENENTQWRNVRYIDNETEQEYTGWVANNYLEENYVISKIVNTDSVMGVTLKLRDAPGGDVIDEIENGSKIDIDFLNVIDMQIDGNDRYIYVTLDDGKSGYIAYDYLEDDNSKVKQNLPTEESKNNALSNYNISSNGDIVGIDISEGITAEQLEEMLQADSFISNQTTSDFHDSFVDTSEISGKINYVYIKIGASSYIKDGKVILQGNPNFFREQARVCEKYGVPYGFYYYSTCITETEAKREAAYINESINLLEDREYNILPFAVNYEIYKKRENDEFGDRQSGINDLTNEKALLAKMISEKQGNVILYVSGFLISDNSSEKQLDWNRYCKIVGDKNVGLWLPAMLDSKIGEYGKLSQKDREYFMPIMQSSGKSYFEQIIMDTSINVLDETRKIDIDIMSEKTFIDLINGQYREMSKAEEIPQEYNIKDFER